MIDSAVSLGAPASCRQASAPQWPAVLRPRPLPSQWSVVSSQWSLLLLLSCVLSASAYDAAQDFSLARNPNGVWSYGWKPSLGGAMHLYQSTVTRLGTLQYWNYNLLSLAPNVARNSASTTVTNFEGASYQVLGPGQLTFHPGPGNQYSDVRFTAPQAGEYRVHVVFSGQDSVGTTTDVHVLHNRTVFYDGKLNGFMVTTPPVTTSTGQLVPWSSSEAPAQPEQCS